MTGLTEAKVKIAKIMVAPAFLPVQVHRLKACATNNQ